MTEVNSDPEVKPLNFSDRDGAIVHPDWPALLYREVLSKPGDGFGSLFRSNRWTGVWRNGIFGYHHYHSNAHEVLGIETGWAEVTFGGEAGETFELEVGDVAILPAGWGHKNDRSSSDLQVIGAYPSGQSNYDLHGGNPSQHGKLLDAISSVKQPGTDPVYGEDGPLLSYWD